MWGPLVLSRAWWLYFAGGSRVTAGITVPISLGGTLRLKEVLWPRERPVRCMPPVWTVVCLGRDLKGTRQEGKGCQAAWA